MNILYINALYSPHVAGGAELSLKLLVEIMQQQGHQVSVLSLMPQGGLMDEYVDDVKVYRASLKNLYWPFSPTPKGKLTRMRWHLNDRYNAAMRRYVREVVAKEKPDIVSCHNLVGWSISVWEELWALKLPIVQVLHDLYLLCPNSDMFKNDQPCVGQCFSCNLLRLQHKSRSHCVNAVVGISRDILDRFEQAGYFTNVHKQIIRNARAIPEPPNLHSRTPGMPLRVGYLGTLSQKKGVEWLIQQFGQLDIQASLLIAGKGQDAYEQHLQSIVPADSISFAGYVKPMDFFATIDVLVVPSIWNEPLGMVAVEALANHLPVIAHGVGGLRETVKHEVNGLLCDYARPDSLGEAIRRLAEDTALYNRLASLARQSVDSLLSPERMAGEYERLLEEIINEK